MCAARDRTYIKHTLRDNSGVCAHVSHDEEKSERAQIEVEIVMSSIYYIQNTPGPPSASFL